RCPTVSLRLLVEDRAHGGDRFRRAPRLAVRPGLDALGRCGHESPARSGHRSHFLPAAAPDRQRDDRFQPGSGDPRLAAYRAAGYRDSASTRQSEIARDYFAPCAWDLAATFFAGSGFSIPSIDWKISS